MTVTKTARQKLRNNTRYYDYTLTMYRDVLEYVNKIVRPPERTAICLLPIRWTKVLPVQRDISRYWLRSVA